MEGFASKGLIQIAAKSLLRDYMELAKCLNFSETVEENICNRQYKHCKYYNVKLSGLYILAGKHL